MVVIGEGGLGAAGKSHKPELGKKRGTFRRKEGERVQTKKTKAPPDARSHTSDSEKWF